MIERVHPTPLIEMHQRRGQSMRNKKRRSEAEKNIRSKTGVMVFAKFAKDICEGHRGG
jgi:hypothetical protein